ncbi:lipopolysaccharide biosynthesis protein [Cellulomonas marina]|uniref:Polysaccharide transporter, PST family n=1 Tax=Cellulomonas marina TaxID=988821 RepID=A0A1I0X277_9CELL|nr:lipopolysaccharide biosynthesis protein [Cellulomonas marina]GIG29362.1 lipopolysaccharide biosynthesis protein [Cellulomonas marina]SFA94520.1 polysaccharide transporter, PST family [Cellulomonas marina]
MPTPPPGASDAAAARPGQSDPAADVTTDASPGADPGAAGPATAAADGAANAARLKTSAISGVKWNFLSTLASLVGRLVFTFALARLIGPENFGIVSLATLYTTFAVVVLDQGFGLALVQRKELGPKDIGSVAWLNLAMGALLCVATILLAPAMADFFSTPELEGVLQVLSITLLIRGLTLVRENLVRRYLRFRQFALIQTGAVIGGGVAGIVAALLGAEYWALVVQTLVNDLVILVSLLVMFRSVSWAASWASLRSMAGFSSKMLASNLLLYVGGNADNILIGRFLNPTQLAFYALSYRLLRMPLQMIGSVVNGVALPIFSRLQDDDERTASWLLVATQAVAVVAFPLFGLMVIAAEAGVEVGFGTEWDGAVVPLQLLALAGAPMIVRMLLPALATARGHAGLVLRWTLINVTLGIAGMVVGLQVAGIVGVAASVAIVTYLTWLPNVAQVLRRSTGLGLGPYVTKLVPPVVCTLLAVGLWWLAYLPFRPSGDEAHGLLPVLGVTLAALAFYAALVRFLFPRTFRAVTSIGTQMVRKQTDV